MMQDVFYANDDNMILKRILFRETNTKYDSLTDERNGDSTSVQVAYHQELTEAR